MDHKPSPNACGENPSTLFTRHRDGRASFRPQPSQAELASVSSCPPLRARPRGPRHPPPTDGGRSVHFVRFGYRRTRHRDTLAAMIRATSERPDLPPAPSPA